jgi:hypothetical protein
VWALFTTAFLAESRISVDIRTSVNISIVSCPLYFPQFILVSIIISYVKFELLNYLYFIYLVGAHR